MQSRTLCLVLTTMLWAGCLDDAPATAVETPKQPFAPVQRNETTGVDEFLRPQWSIGRWWNVEVTVDNGYGFLNELRGTLVVGQANETGFRVGATSEGLGIYDEYFDHFHVGDFDRHLNASIGGVNFQPFAWPLAPGRTWTTQYPLLDESYGPRPQNVTLSVATFEDTPPTERLRVTGRIEHGPTFDYDYSAKTGWMTYFRMVNATTGRVQLSIDYRETGDEHRGVVHHLRSTPLYFRIVVLPPCDQQGCDARVGGVPPTERVQVPKGYDWVEAFSFLFVYPFGPAGAGEAAYTIVRPDLKESHHVFHHAGDRFRSNFTRTQVRAATEGEWGITLHAAGTAGVLVLLLGFHDDRVEL